MLPWLSDQRWQCMLTVALIATFFVLHWRCAAAAAAASALALAERCLATAHGAPVLCKPSPLLGMSSARRCRRLPAQRTPHPVMHLHP